MVKLSDRLITGLLIVFAFFMYAANQSTVNLFYGLMIAAHGLLVFSDKNVRIPFEHSEDGRLKGFTLAIGSYLAYIYLVPILVTSILGAKIVLDMAGILNTTQLWLPELIVASKWTAILTAAAYGVIETLFIFGSWLELLQDELFGGETLLSYATVVASFLVFHIFIKKSVDINGINTGLVATLAFAIVSVWLVWKTKQTREASTLHGVTNGVAESIKQFGMNAMKIILGG